MKDETQTRIETLRKVAPDIAYPAEVDALLVRFTEKILDDINNIEQDLLEKPLMTILAMMYLHGNIQIILTQALKGS